MPIDKNGNFLMEGDIVKIGDGEERWKVVHLSGREVGIVKVFKHGFSRRVSYHPGKLFTIVFPA